MITTVKVVGSNKLIAAIGKALVVSNVISVVSFLGIGGLIIWQVHRGTEGVKTLGTKIDSKAESQDLKNVEVTKP